MIDSRGGLLGQPTCPVRELSSENVPSTDPSVSGSRGSVKPAVNRDTGIINCRPRDNHFYTLLSGEYNTEPDWSAVVSRGPVVSIELFLLSRSRSAECMAMPCIVDVAQENIW